MNILAVLEQVRELLRTRGRITYRMLKRQFDLDDDYLEDIKAELIDAERVAVDEDGKVLVWVRGRVKEKGEEANRGKGERGGKTEAEKWRNGEVVPASQFPVAYTLVHLADRIRAEQAAPEARGMTGDERKTITVLFADLKGSTALIDGLDPEEARALIDPALQIMMDAVHRYEGYVAQALGDGIFALFGAPLAYEDHPQRALYAALRMQDEMRRYGDQVRLKHGVPLAMRVGVNTGEVVMRSIRKDDVHTDYVPVGHATNLAARMEQMATPGSILITEDTKKLVEGYFALKALGAAEIKGRAEPLQVYEVLGAGPLRTRLQVATRRGLTRFVGRQTELEQMQQALAQAKAGHGQIVGVIGEPGLGKSRLFYEFKLLASSSCLILDATPVSYGKTSPYLPVIDLLKSYFRIEPLDDERTRREKVGGKVLMLDRGLEDTLPYLFALLGVEEQPSLLQQMDPQIRRQRTFAALKKLFLRESLQQPLILIFEDLHWIDSETQGFLDILGESVASAHILLLVNYRPEYHHEWGQKTYYTQLHLEPFGKVEAEEFLDALLRTTGETLPVTSLQTLKQLILEKTEGTPFFMEEVVLELFEQGMLARNGVEARGVTPRLTDLQIPSTVQGILAARIDRLAPDEKALLQQLAVIGREFPLSLIRHVVPQAEEEVYRLLAALQRKEFLYERPAFPEVEYLFKHALTQEVSYNSVLIERRKALHEQTAQAIERLFHDRLEAYSAELAHHYQRSGNIEKAIDYLQRAGQKAAQYSIHEEAVTHVTTALELLQSLPDTPERVQQELTLQLSLAASLQVTKGPSAAEVAAVYTRAQALCQRGGTPPQFFSVLRGLWVLHHVQADLAAAGALGKQMLEMAARAQDATLLLEAHRALGSTFLWQGEFALAHTHLAAAIALYDQHQHQSLPVPSGGATPGVSCLCEIARVLWFLGYPEQALLRSQEALALARSLSDPFSFGFALVFAAGLHQLRREGALAQSRAEEGIAVAREYGFSSLVSAGTIRRGWALTAQGQEETGLYYMQQGVAARQATGAELAQPYFLALEAEVYGKLGQSEYALTLLSKALAAMTTSGEYRLEAELHRLRGELLLATEEAEKCFRQAIEIAQRQQAKSLELRAVMSLTRLWQQQGKIEETYSLLSNVYNWFTEGFDTQDLQEAKTLIEGLRH